MLKQGSMKLNINVAEFLIDEDQSAFLTTINHEEQDSAKDIKKSLNFPFIKYLEGSYFGDVDILIPGLKRFERDSTAVASSKESHFFVLSRQNLMTLKHTFEKEIREMENLAVLRKRKHQQLIGQLCKKIQLIQKTKKTKTIGNYDFYQTELVHMEEIERVDNLNEDRD